MSKLTRNQTTSKKKSDESKGPLPACPKKDNIFVAQFQYFDNGEPKKSDVDHVVNEDGTISKKRAGAGRSRYTMNLEVYCEAKFNIYKPHWKRTVGLLDPEKVKKWSNEKLAEGKLTAEEHAFYAGLYDMTNNWFDNTENPDWARIGYIEDRRSKVRYPGQAVLVTKVKDGPMDVFMFTEGLTNNPIVADRMQFDRRSRPGSGRRLFYGFYDPFNMYDLSKEMAQTVAAKPALDHNPKEFDRFNTVTPF
jgi:hypothetical protein